VQAHLARVELAFSRDEILTLHDRTRQWRKTKKKVVSDCVSSRHSDVSSRHSDLPAPPPQPKSPPRAPRPPRRRTVASPTDDDDGEEDRGRGTEEHVGRRLLAKFRGSPRRSRPDAPPALTPISATPALILATPRSVDASQRPLPISPRLLPAVADAKRHAADTESMRKARARRRSWTTD
jgi:hypothetical protein